MTPGMLAKICQAVDIPVVAIGGLNKEHLELLKGTGVDGIAVVSALFAADDIEKAAEELKEAVSFAHAHGAKLYVTANILVKKMA